MCQDPVSATSETYKLEVPTFKNGKPEGMIQMMKYFKSATDGTETTSATGKIDLLHTMLHGETLRGFDVLAGQVESTTNGHLKLIKEGLLAYFLPSMHLTIRKAR